MSEYQERENRLMDKLYKGTHTARWAHKKIVNQANQIQELETALNSQITDTALAEVKLEEAEDQTKHYKQVAWNLKNLHETNTAYLEKQLAMLKGGK